MVSVDHLPGRRRHGREDPEPREREDMAGDHDRLIRDRRSAYPVKSVASSNEVALDLMDFPVEVIMDAGQLPSKLIDFDVTGAENDLLTGLQTGANEIRDKLPLPINGHGPPVRQIAHRYPVGSPPHAPLDALVPHPLAPDTVIQAEALD